jgi:hypothetical protein
MQRSSSSHGSRASIRRPRIGWARCGAPIGVGPKRVAEAAGCDAVWCQAQEFAPSGRVVVERVCFELAPNVAAAFYELQTRSTTPRSLRAHACRHGKDAANLLDAVEWAPRGPSRRHVLFHAQPILEHLACCQHSVPSPPRRDERHRRIRALREHIATGQSDRAAVSCVAYSTRRLSAALLESSSLLQIQAVPSARRSMV